MSLLVLFSLIVRLDFHDHPAQMDEYDYLFVGNWLLSGQSWPTYSYIFGSDLSWYILAWGDSVMGGLDGARAIAGLFGLASIIGMYILMMKYIRVRMRPIERYH